MCKAESQIRQKFDTFVKGYIDKNIEMTMSIFAPDVIANVQQAPSEQTYQDIKNSILKDFADSELEYSYRYIIKEIECTDTIAIVRVIWKSSVFDPKRNAVIKMKQEVGMDIFKYRNNEWQLYRFITYPEKI
jgi:hypothetical protein